jgi:hypothetical protein
MLAGYVVFFPPLFVLGPLAGLLVASRPGTFKEWAWIAAAGLWLLVTLGQPGGLAAQMLHAWALFVTGAFVVLMLPGRRALVPGALLATVFGLGAATAWAWLLGSGWQDIQLAAAHTGWEFCRQLLGQSALGPERFEELRTYVNALGAAVGIGARLLPALLILTALPGLALAWSWYHRLSAHPAGAPGGRFADFRFSDHLVWLVVVCSAAFILPIPPGIQGLMGNLALVSSGLYAARGAAVLWSNIESFPAVVLGIVVVGMLFILPVALGGCFALGLADTWVDFRRRFPPAAMKRSEPWK